MAGNTRNFCIIAHIDHGKSTLADRMLEITGTVEPRKMREQYLDTHPLERERGITIKMTPVRMLWHPHRGKDADDTQNNAELLYGDLTYKIRGILFGVRRKLGLGHKEQVYHNALEIEFRNAGILFESKKSIAIRYEGKSIGIYQPDFIIENNVLIELKALPEIGRPQIEQVWSYLKGCEYKLALLVNYGSRDLEIKRIVYDTAREIRSALSALSQRKSAQVEYVLNLIDTPGHIDFTYEVSRALAAVEGAVLLVDATQGVEAQTIANFELARSLNLAVVPVINKIDLPQARIMETREEIKNLLGCGDEEILAVSAKTGEGVERLLEEIVRRIPPPRWKTLEITEVEPPYGGSTSENLQALVFDFDYSPHRGVIAHVRVFGGGLKRGLPLMLFASGTNFSPAEVGVFKPELEPKDSLGPGEIGYIVTGIKEAGLLRIGDTVLSKDSGLPSLPGYREIQPVVFSSIYPANQDKFDDLRKALGRLKLIDSSLFFEEESSGPAAAGLGRGFRCGFLGMLHLEIVVERLRRDFGVEVVAATPTVRYRVVTNKGDMEIYSPVKFPDLQAGEHNVKEILEPYLKIEILTPPDKLPGVIKLLKEHEADVGETIKFSEARLKVKGEMPLRELMRDFFDALKSVSAGYASLNYEFLDARKADILKLEVLVAEEVVPAFSRIVPRHRVEREAEEVVERLYGTLPRALFPLKIQARAAGRILASRTLRPLSKNVTGHLYGGDRSRKMKLWKKQKRGKKKLRARGDYEIPPEVYLKMRAK